MGYFIGLVLGILLIWVVSYLIQDPWYKKELKLFVSPKCRRHHGNVEYHIYVRKSFFIYRKVRVCDTEYEVMGAIRVLGEIHAMHNIKKGAEYGKDDSLEKENRPSKERGN
mgnify:CR=1 FL=1